MLCEICEVSEANAYLETEFNGKISPRHLCRKCMMLYFEGLSEEDWYREVASGMGMEFVPVIPQVPASVLSQFPSAIARQYTVFPIALSDASVPKWKVAISDPMDFEARDAIEFLLSQECDYILAPKQQIVEAVKKEYES